MGGSWCICVQSWGEGARRRRRCGRRRETVLLCSNNFSISFFLSAMYGGSSAMARQALALAMVWSRSTRLYSSSGRISSSDTILFLLKRSSLSLSFYLLPGIRSRFTGSRQSALSSQHARRTHALTPQRIVQLWLISQQLSTSAAPSQNSSSSVSHHHSCRTVRIIDRAVVVPILFIDIRLNARFNSFIQFIHSFDTFDS